MFTYNFIVSGLVTFACVALAHYIAAREPFIFSGMLSSLLQCVGVVSGVMTIYGISTIIGFSLDRWLEFSASADNEPWWFGLLLTGQFCLAALSSIPLWICAEVVGQKAAKAF